MSYAVVLTENAKADLVSISRYIARDLQSWQNAASQLARLEKAIRSLNEMPERYRVYDDAKWQGRNLRILSVDHYLVFYIPDKDRHTVTVLRVLYGGSDWARQLQDLN